MKVTQISHSALSETGKLVREHRRLVRIVKQRAETQVLDHRAYLTTFDVFVGWRDQNRL